MRAAVESIEDGVATDPRHALAVLGSQLRAMDAMLTQLIEFSRLESGHVSAEVERVSLAELADECIEALAPLATAGNVRLMLAVDGPAIVTGSSLELSRVLRNLVDNAVRHSPVDTEVTVAVAGDAHSVRLSVIDRGPGFPPDFRDRAFEPFHRADPSRNARTGNTGLGLAICRAIVHAHGGTISLGDGPSGQVHVVLPASPPRSIARPTIGVFS
jgi:signal transduction histidine kinase